MSNVVRLEYAYGACPKCGRKDYLRYLIHNDGLIHKPYEIKCINCNSYFSKNDILGGGEETTPKPKTNADRIRSMTDEELAEAFSSISCCYEKAQDCMKYSDGKGGRNCKKCWLDWLKQEASEE